MCAFKPRSFLPMALNKFSYKYENIKMCDVNILGKRASPCDENCKKSRVQNDAAVPLAELIVYIEEAGQSRKTRLNVRSVLARRLIPVLGPLRDLHSLIGMKKLKSQIVDLVLYIASKLNQSNEYYHCIVTGGPGLGKSTVISILAKIYAGLNITKGDHIVYVKKADLVSKYLGQTAHDTTAKLEKALGGVMVLDEAYQITPSGRERDKYGEEAINTINQFLSEHCDDFVLVLAGYKDRIENDFLSYNQGLSSRFPYRFDLEEYTPKQLYRILNSVVIEKGWLIDCGCMQVLMSSHKLFTAFGRDMHVLFQNCKKIVTRKIWNCRKYMGKIIMPDTLELAIQEFSSHHKGEMESHQMKEDIRNRMFM